MESGIRGFLQDIDEHCFGLGMRNDPLYYDMKEIVFCHPKVKDNAVNVYNDLYDENIKELVNDKNEMLKETINEKEIKIKKKRP